MLNIFKERGKLSWKITVVYTLMFILVILLVNAAVYLFLSNFIENSIENSISSTGEFVISQIKGIGGINVFDAEILQEISRSEGNIFFRVLNTQAEITAQSKYLENMEIPLSRELTEFSISGRNLAVKTIDLDQAVFSNGYLQIVRDITFEKNFLDVLIIVLTAAGFAGTMAALIVGYITTKKMLNPIKKITETAREISLGDLGKRLSVTGTDDELEQLADTFNTMLARLEKSFKREKQFVSDASHELRTPLSVIKGYINLLDRWGKEKKEVRDEAITAIKNEVEGMNHLLENLLFLARGDDSLLNREENIFSFSDLLSEIVKEICMVNEQIDIELDIKDEVEFFGDRKLFKQLIRIFVDNSINFTDEDGWINILLKKEKNKNEDMVRIVVEDNGHGIPEEDLPHIFERFYQADKSRSRKKKGSGLGLAIAKQIIDSYDGQIEAESKISEGTKINVLLPLKSSRDSA
ncbi:MAG: sensor histidine kinase [Bacillota bacterium]